MFRTRSMNAAAAVPLLLAAALGVATVEPARAQTAAPAKPKAAEKARTRAGAATAPRIDLNTATAQEMVDTLPGVGEVTAGKIVAGRPYRTVDDLAGAGVPEREIERLRPLVTLSPPPEPRAKAVAKAKTAAPEHTPGAAAPRVDINTATAARLETLPGIGPTHAREIIAGRPFRSVDDLERVKGLGKTRIDAIRDRVTLSDPTPAVTTTTGEMTPKKATRPATATTTTTTTRPATAARPALKAATGRAVNLNTATREELDALPGIGPVKAEAILEYRQAQRFKAREDVMKVKGIKEGEFAKIRDLITVE